MMNLWNITLTVKMNKWLNIPNDYSNFVGFVYIVEEIDTGMKYIGQKSYWRTKKVKPTKYKRKDGKFLKDKNGKRILNKRMTRKHFKVETDWKTYNTSSPIMQKNLEENPDNYIKTIINSYTSISEVKAEEAYLQLQYWKRGDWNLLYNEVINLRVRFKK